MSKNNENKLVPRLRFPEFTYKTTWANRKLSEVLFEHKEKSTGKEEVYSVSVHKGVVNQIEHLGRTFAASNTENYKRVLPGDIIYTKSPTGCFPLGIIKQSKVSKPVIVSPLYGVFKPETIDLGLILDAYFEYPERTINYLSSIVQKGAKNTININNDTFLSKSLILPTDKLEQQKIAACLSSLDDVITAESKKLEVLKEHKKGLLQNLFPQEGETVPKLRFKEFEDSGEWEVKTLGEVFTSFSGGTPSTSKKMYYEGSIPFIRSAEINKTSTELFLTDLGLRNSSAKMVSKGDLLVALYGANSGDVAISKIEGAINQAILCLKSEFSNSFVYHYLSGKKSWIVSKYIQGGQGNLSGEIVKSISVSFPSKPEQQKIAACLSSLDDLINAQSQKIETLKLHKKGLLQGLFPDVNEHNG
jgi:type I restriction enzyme S subunit